jgi:hypothetical protein
VVTENESEKEPEKVTKRVRHLNSMYDKKLSKFKVGKWLMDSEEIKKEIKKSIPPEYTKAHLRALQGELTLIDEAAALTTDPDVQGQLAMHYTLIQKDIDDIEKWRRDQKELTDAAQMMQDQQ